MLDGDKIKFDRSWKSSKEANYSHWTRKKPQNQIQFAFRNHWITFNKIIKKNKLKQKRVLEVGCGRGSLSAYFADNKWECTLLDSSSKAISIAKHYFNKNKLKASYLVADCKNIPYPEKSFDLVFSIGLLEHFKNPEKIIKEQIRVLDKGGLFIGYIVPEIKNNIQDQYEWINKIFTLLTKSKNNKNRKKKIYRTNYMCNFYKQILKKNNLMNIKSSGIYPVPMISISKSFPFTLMDINIEKVIVNHFEKLLYDDFNNSWLCNEKKGQAILVWGTKK